MSENLLNKIVSIMNKVKNENPLTICITNAVTINDCANAILAIDGSPAITDYSEDVGELITIAKALVINLGMLNDEKIKGIFKACDVATKIGLPIIIDPVAVGVTENRNKLIIKLIENYNINSIRGNISEIKAIAKLLNLDEIKNLESNLAKGVDANEKDIITQKNLKKNTSLIKSLAKKIDSVIVCSGPVDVISDGDEIYCIKNGDKLMTKITGSGCVLTSIIGSYIGSSNSIIGSITGTLVMGIAGEQAKEYIKKENSGTGTFRTKLIDYLSQMNEKTILEKNKIFKME